MYFRRLCFVLSCLTILAGPARAVSLLNGSVLSLNGLTLTVSNCSMVLSDVTQSSCASGHLALQATGGGKGYTLTGDGTGSNGSNIFSMAEGSGLSQVRFKLTIAPAVVSPGSKLVSAALTVQESVPNYCDLLDFTMVQKFSSEVGGGTLQVTPTYSDTGVLGLTPGNSFSISNTFAINSKTYNGWGSIQLTSVRQTFTPAPEPASLAVLLTGGLGLLAVRWRSKTKSRAAGGQVG